MPHSTATTLYSVSNAFHNILLAYVLIFTWPQYLPGALAVPIVVKPHALPVDRVEQSNYENGRREGGITYYRVDKEIEGKFYWLNQALPVHNREKKDHALGNCILIRVSIRSRIFSFE